MLEIVPGGRTSARTMTLDPKTHRLDLSAASSGPAPASQPKTKDRRNDATGSFAIGGGGE